MTPFPPACIPPTVLTNTTEEPEHGFAGDPLEPAETELTRFDDVAVDRPGWARVEVQRGTDRIRVRCRDRTESWTVEVGRRAITVTGPDGEGSLPDWVRETVTWSAVDPSLVPERLP